MTRDGFEEVHVELKDGRTIYWPKGDMSRLAKPAVCSVASRMVQLRAVLKRDPLDMRELERLINLPIAFEDKFLSGDSIVVHNAIKELGRNWLEEAASHLATGEGRMDSSEASKFLDEYEEEFGMIEDRDSWERRDRS